MAKKWYIVHTYSGFEYKVKSALEERIKTDRKEDLFGEILVPTERVIELVKDSGRLHPGSSIRAIF